MMKSFSLSVYVIIACLMFHAGKVTKAADYFGIRVVDSESKRGVPLVCLKTVNDIEYWTDSAGYIAIDEPGFVGREVYFAIRSHGYEYPADGFGFRGVRLTVEPGTEATVEVKRSNVAERLYRVTGAGIYRDSVLLGKEVPIDAPLINASVLGSDSVMTAVRGNRIHWFWGDTNVARYPLGIFDTPGAVSKLPGSGGLDPNVGVNLKYFVDDSGVVKATCKMPGSGPTWIEGLTVLDQEDSSTSQADSLPAMFCGYAKIRPPLEVYERGIAEWDDATESFESKRVLPANTQAYLMGHPVQTQVDGVDYVYYSHPLPLVRVPATREAVLDPDAYETYSYVRSAELSGSDVRSVVIDRDEVGVLVWKWRRGGIRPTRELEDAWRKSKLLREDEGAFRMRTQGSPRTWTLHTASVAWNEYRGKWIMIGLEVGGESSMLGEVYYLEADRLEGPWSEGKKIVTHDRYSFYNPRLHPMLSQQNGKVVFFEGTYTKTFSSAPHATPRYDYNQIMYRLDLSSERLGLVDKGE